jgi:hypothetical protein
MRIRDLIEGNNLLIMKNKPSFELGLFIVGLFSLG